RTVGGSEDGLPRGQTLQMQLIWLAQSAVLELGFELIAGDLPAADRANGPGTVPSPGLARGARRQPSTGDRVQDLLSSMFVRHVRWALRELCLPLLTTSKAASRID